MNDLDKLLNQLKNEYLPEKSATQPEKKIDKPPLTPPQSPLDHMLKNVKQEVEEKKTPSPSPNKINKDYQAQDALVEELKQEKAAQEQLRQQQQLELELAEKRRQAQQQQQQQKALETKAQEWLKQLNPHSEEGLWFEEFAYTYDSKLAAAIDYLKALGA